MRQVEQSWRNGPIWIALRTNPKRHDSLLRLAGAVRAHCCGERRATGWYADCIQRTMNKAAVTAKPLWEVQLPGDSHWSGVLRRGVTLRLTALDDGANLTALFYNHEQLAERYNMADTLKAQHTAYLTAGCVCYSDMGRILCSMTADTCGWHDAFTGLSDQQSVEQRFGRTRFQEQRNARFGNGRDAMLNELGKYGMGARDLVPVINFFTKVTPQTDGSLRHEAAHCRADAYVDLRFEMDTLALFYAGPHPLDDNRRFAPKAVALSARYTGPAPAQDACRDRCPENQRGFQNTEMMFVT
jgi:urea carboxylase-associated protein 2